MGCVFDMKISIIAACDKSRLIGVDGKMPWQDDPAIKEDLKRFKAITMGHTIVMGTGTKKSLGHMFPLPGRKNIVLTKSRIYPVFQTDTFNCYFANNIDTGLLHARSNNVKEVFLIGGQRVFEEGLQYADTIYLTEVDGEYDGIDQDSKRYFPVLNDKKPNFILVSLNSLLYLTVAQLIINSPIAIAIKISLFIPTSTLLTL